MGLPRGWERVLFVHAHPDDETISTGGTIAVLTASGADVIVLTCTRGERGEVIPDALKRLEGDADALAAERERELAEAIAALGVRDHRYLGDPAARRPGAPARRYLDSGMQWGPDGAIPLPDLDRRSLAAAELTEVVDDVYSVIVATQPSAVVSYDANGGYGHPDHIRAHQAARLAAAMANVPFYERVSADQGEPADGDPADRDADALAEIRFDTSAVTDRVLRALRAHRTQVTVSPDGSFALSSGPSRRISGTESYRLVEDLDALASEDPDRGFAGFGPISHGAAQPGAAEAWQGLGWRAKLVGCALALACGLLTGGITTVNHQQTIELFGTRMWVGVAISLALVAGVLVGARVVFRVRTVAAWAALGILAAVGTLSLEGPGGSVLVPANGAGWFQAYGPLVIAAVVLAWPAAGTFARGSMMNKPSGKGTPSP